MPLSLHSMHVAMISQEIGCPNSVLTLFWETLTFTVNKTIIRKLQISALILLNFTKNPIENIDGLTAFSRNPVNLLIFVNFFMKCLN